MNTNDLKQLLFALYEECEQDLAKNLDRSIPFADTVLRNRWKRAEHLNFGKGASIYDSAIVLGDVSVGEQTWIGPNVILDGAGGGLKIGDFCSVSAGVHIYTHDTVLWAVSMGVAPHRQGVVSIGDGCHIGAQSIILPGVSIGSQSVVAANSVVNKDVPPRTIVGGTPARILGKVEGDGEDVQLVIGSHDQDA